MQLISGSASVSLAAFGVPPKAFDARRRVNRKVMRFSAGDQSA